MSPDDNIFTATSNDEASDGEDMVQDGESEMTDGDITMESSASNFDASLSDQAIRVSPPETPTAPKISKASHTAATRGLNVAITPSDRGNRYSRMIGLPASPRSPVQGSSNSAKPLSS